MTLDSNILDLMRQVEKAEADLEKALAANVALRDAGRKADYALRIGYSDYGDYGLKELLAAPDPGAKVRAVVEAARKIKSAHHVDFGKCRCFLCEAVSAIDAPEGQQER